MLDFMAHIRAIHNLAKTYHWKTSGKEFYGDHLFFDRIAEEFDEELVDTIAEQFYMANPLLLNDLNDLTYKTYEIEQRYFTGEYDPKHMFNSMYEIIFNLNAIVNKTETVDRYVNVILDEIASKCEASLGLLTGRIDSRDLPTYYESTTVRNALTEGFIGSKVLNTLGVSSEELNHCYNTGESLANDLSAQLGTSTALSLLESASKKSSNKKLYESAIRSLSSK